MAVEMHIDEEFKSYGFVELPLKKRGEAQGSAANSEKVRCSGLHDYSFHVVCTAIILACKSCCRSSLFSASLWKCRRGGHILSRKSQAGVTGKKEASFT